MAHYKGKKELTEKEMKEWIHELIKKNTSSVHSVQSNPFSIRNTEISPISKKITSLLKRDSHPFIM